MQYNVIDKFGYFAIKLKELPVKLISKASLKLSDEE